MVQRRRATSADGTEVPYFLITPAGWSGAGPTLLWGYGGFKIPIFADYRPGWTGWLAAGGALVIANLRGGGEFGTDWYHAGRLDRKQNVFDDAIAVAEDLIATGVTTSDQLAVHGRSNGGLLVGALITQRPDLFAAAVPGGRGAGPAPLPPVHRRRGLEVRLRRPRRSRRTSRSRWRTHRCTAITEGASYPATLVLTGDHDDRVVPLHSHKFTRRAAAGPGRRRAGADPDRDRHRPRCRQADHAGRGGVGRPAGVRPPTTPGLAAG